ncbi:MAG: beta-galactosidase trimerization domain-containing protein [Niabella sp.]
MIKQNVIRLALLLNVMLLYGIPVAAQTQKDEKHVVGAEIFIEPGQTREEMDTWFRLMKESGMTLTRIRMFENYMRNDKGEWDFKLFDQAFEAGERYGINIYANLFPATPFDDIGGFKFPKNKKHLESISEYIRQLAQHFSKFKSLYGWVPINEPGIGGKIDNGNFTSSMFADWKKEKADSAGYNSHGFVHFSFEEEKFLLYYNTWFLKWLTEEIRKYDPERPVHVNNHDLFRNVAEYDFPVWRQFLTSLGGSAHASWHFGYFDRQQYALAMDANCEILRSGAGNIPWLMTELQGGNNTYSGANPMCPTAEEILQWLWLSLANESKGSVFWCLNPRGSGIEAGEWALLDFQNRPTDRMTAISKFVHTIREYDNLFSRVNTVQSGVNLLYIREALWVENKLLGPVPNKEDIEARNYGASMKSLLAYHQSLAGLGVQANVKEIGEFDFALDDYSGISIILANQVSVPSRYWSLLESFVAKGGHLIVEGLTAFYDENAVSLMRNSFPFKNLFGGEISEFRFVDNKFLFSFSSPQLQMPSHAWLGFIDKSSGSPLATYHKKITAVSNTFGKGKVVWIPSLLGLGARQENTYSRLAEFVQQYLPLDKVIRFSAFHDLVLMKNIRANGELISIIINKNKSSQTVSIKGLKSTRTGELLFSGNGKPGRTIAPQNILVKPEETLVVRWKQ